VSDSLKYEMNTWEIQKAPSESDIVWSDLNKINFFSNIKKVFLISILFLVSVILVTPLTLFDIAKPLADLIDEELLENSLLANYLP